MVELVDTQDLKSCESNLVRVRFPLLVLKSLAFLRGFLYFGVNIFFSNLF